MAVVELAFFNSYHQGISLRRFSSLPRHFHADGKPRQTIALKLHELGQLPVIFE